MKRWLLASICVLTIVSVFSSGNLTIAASPGSDLNQVLNRENQERGIKLKPVPLVDDLAFLRRISVDLGGRIPTEAEIQEYLSWPTGQRRAKVIQKLLADERFTDRWTTFLADMLRLRSNAEGGAAAIAFVHRAVQDGMPYDELCRRLIATNGKAGATPEVGFILGDNADPMALAGATSQVFMGVRIACAQCHDHPFDVWTREDFYGFAAYFGKTRRVETQFTNLVYTTDVAQSTILWPPVGVGDAGERKPMKPTFPIGLAKYQGVPNYIAKLTSLRKAQAEREKKKLASAGGKSSADATLDALLAKAAKTADKRSKGTVADAVLEEAKRDVRKIKVRRDLYRRSDLRTQLAEFITSPRNRFFSRCFVNRVWAELVGRGFVNPVDDFSESNKPSHPKTLDYLADEFVANGYDVKTLIRMVVSSEAYQRGHATGFDELTQTQMESAFVATPMRRMISEVLYDSMVVAGHLFDVKHEAGKNLKVVWQQTRVAKEPAEKPDTIKPVKLAATPAKKKMPAMKKKRQVAAVSPYDLEKAIELDFKALLSESKQAVQLEKMQVMSKEEIEAMRMQEQMREQRPDLEYFDRFIKSIFDDNPSFSTAFRMASPAVPEHFLRIFGQPARTELGEARDHNPTMRQALMMLNGRITHEASRVGELEPIYPLLVGKRADLTKAIQLAYREILTRNPETDEIADAKAVVQASGNPLTGMSDLRWVLLNSNEFRFLP